ncbi:protein phosphatase, Mg2+/Mn2+ dependent, 1Na (putative) [Engraulis encrasicolus]|uniref:protein phosphatase, Mg2+/Mn2+ dependent, 1Na (putative) n=1 Tax=Engraulis encrasicolus TaxID=184585 RepID=UPI002FD34697
MRTARRASTVEVPSFLRNLAKETERMMTFFFRNTGGSSGSSPRDSSSGEDDELNDDDDSMPSPYLQRPLVHKSTGEGGADWGLSYAVASMQGWRAQMEDAHSCQAELDGDLSQWGYYAVFDGHAGTMVAQHCARNLLKHILATGGVRAEEDPEQVKEGIVEGFLDIDRQMHEQARRDNWDRSGSTATAVMVSPQHFYFINCGDSRAFLCRSGRVHFYTEDHKPMNPRERERIQNAGGTVTLQRVNGSLAVSRSLGDFDFKEVSWRAQTEQLVSPEPEVYELERSEEDEFLVVACDGIWDAMSNEDLCSFVRSRLEVCDDLREVCTQVLDLCLYKGSLDNMSIIIISLPGAPKVSQEALQREAEMELCIDGKVEEALQLLHSRDEEPDLLFVMKFLTAEYIPGLPPGGGVTSKRDCILASFQKYCAACKPQEAMDTGGSDESNQST